MAQLVSGKDGIPTEEANLASKFVPSHHVWMAPKPTSFLLKHQVTSKCKGL